RRRINAALLCLAHFPSKIGLAVPILKQRLDDSDTMESAFVALCHLGLDRAAALDQVVEALVYAQVSDSLGSSSRHKTFNLCAMLGENAFSVCRVLHSLLFHGPTQEMIDDARLVSSARFPPQPGRISKRQATSIATRALRELALNVAYHNGLA